MEVLHFLCLSIHLLYFLSHISTAADTLSLSQSMSDGDTLVSKGGSFELGFFTPGESKGRYLGIWYSKIAIRTVVWVANRDKPINNSSGVLMINSTGYITLKSKTDELVWSSTTSEEAENPVLQLLDSGNLVLRDEKYGNSESYLWQSFDYPSDTLLPGMKLGWDSKTGLNRHILSWKDSDDPSPGELTFGIGLHSYPETVMHKGSILFYRAGPWNGLQFSGAPDLRPNPVFEFNFFFNKEEIYYMYQLKNMSMISRLVLTQNNYPSLQRYVWITAEQTWKIYRSLPRDQCDNYGLCGAYGVCFISESPICQCLEGFRPRSQETWNSMDWSHGCVRNKPLTCHIDGFAKFVGLKLPDTTHSWVNTSMNLKECKAKCFNNCSCMAYSNTDIRGEGSGCAMWFGDLIDIRKFSEGGQELYIRMPISELGPHTGRKLEIAMTTVAVTVVFSGMLTAYWICKHKRNLEENRRVQAKNNEGQKEDLELPLFNLATIANATDNFSDEKKVGEGGFGPVYKGTLSDGQEVAVKRLSMNSVQGLNEFKNEVILIAKLQHRNLVKLLGCCIQEEEKMLIYEYLPNKSLDSFIFDKEKGKLLGWSKRFHIISGIARGLLYLHQDSRLRIIHRDLKASNVLLDNEMNPKISDFGLARTFGSEQLVANTKRVIGTYGYMAPEYVIDGLFSTKSDVFSFGVLLLEIVSGKKNRGFCHQNHSLNLIGHAWSQWKEGRPLELIDALYVDSCIPSQVLRCIHIGLLCVQRRPEDRPNISYVVLMLASENVMPQPKQPGFFIEADSSSSKRKSCSTNEITLTLLEAR